MLGINRMLGEVLVSVRDALKKQLQLDGFSETSLHFLRKKHEMKPLLYKDLYELSLQASAVDADCKQQGLPSGTCHIDYQPDDYKNADYHCRMRELLEPYAATILYQVQIKEKEPNWQGKTEWVAATCFWLGQAQAYYGLLQQPGRQQRGRRISVKTTSIGELLPYAKTLKQLLFGIEKFHFIYPPQLYSKSSDRLWHFHGGEHYPLLVENNRVIFPADWKNDRYHCGPLWWEHGYLQVINEQGLSGLINVQGEITLACRYAYLGKMSSVSQDEVCLEAAVEVDGGTCDLITLKGEQINPAGVKVVPDSLCGNIVKVCQEVAGSQPLYGYMDTTGNLLGEIRWKRCGPHLFRGAQVQCANTGLYGFVDEQGNVTIEPQFVDATPFNNGFAIVALDHSGKKGVVDETGRMIISPQWHDMETFDRDHFRVADEKGATGLIDLQGNVVVPLCLRSGDLPEGDDYYSWHQVRDHVRQELFEQMHQQLKEVRSKVIDSLAPYAGIFRRDADERDLKAAGLWLQNVELLTDYSGLEAGAIGRISYYYPVSANCFNWLEEVPVTGLYEDNGERALGVPWAVLRVVE